MKKELIFLILTTILFGCEKTKEPEPKYYQLATDVLSCIQLPGNSYYIYKDSAAASEDSVVVVTSSFDKIYVPAVQAGFFNSTLACYYQVYTLKLKSQNMVTTDYWFSGSASTRSNSFEVFVLDTRSNNVTYSVFIYPTHGRFISSMVVEGNTYINIEKHEFNYLSPNPAGNISGVYYWAKGVGIIKRQITIGGSIKTESLLRHG